MRICSGFDAHRYGEEKAGHRIMLGGVAVPWQRVVVAHSDGDVILHALCDAILGALALGDIGRHFPDTDPAYANADSRQLLRACVAKVAARGMLLVNADITLIAERPKVAAYVDAMCATSPRTWVLPLTRSVSRPLPQRKWVLSGVKKAWLPRQWCCWPIALASRPGLACEPVI